MKALTIHRPWTDAIAYLPNGKRIENRSWPPGSVLGKRIAIHAGKAYDRDGAEDIQDLLEDREYAWHVPTADESPTGVVATARVLGVVTRHPRATTPGHPRTEAPVYSSGVHVVPDLAWWTGDSIGWVLDDVVGIPAVPCKGRQGLWLLPGLVERDVLARVEAVRAGLMDPRPANARAWERRAELEALDEVALRKRAMAAGYRTLMPSLAALAFGEVSDEMRREQQQLAERRARRARR